MSDEIKQEPPQPLRHHPRKWMSIREWNSWLERQAGGQIFVGLFLITWIAVLLLLVTLSAIGLDGRVLRSIANALLGVTILLTGLFLYLRIHAHRGFGQNSTDRHFRLVILAGELLVSIFLSIGIIEFLRRTQIPTGSPIGGDVGSDFFKSVFTGVVVGLVIFLFKLYADTAGDLLDANEQNSRRMRTLEEETKRLADHGVLLSDASTTLRTEASRIKEANEDAKWISSFARDYFTREFRDDCKAEDPAGDLHRDLIDLGLDYARATRLAAAQVPAPLPRSAWLAFARAYAQEEIFDLAGYDLVTNVRNYAFGILEIVRQLAGTIGDDEQLVILNSSPFSPKDFYNWPHRRGSNGFRQYHEAEFFGIYRRLFSRLLHAHQKEIVPFRILHSAKDHPRQEMFRHAQSFAVDAGLGWSIDPTEKLIWDLARHSIYPCAEPLQQSSSVRTRFYTCYDPNRDSVGAVRTVSHFDREWRRRAEDYAPTEKTLRQNDIAQQWQQFDSSLQSNIHGINSRECESWAVIEAELRQWSQPVSSTGSQQLPNSAATKDAESVRLRLLRRLEKIRIIRQSQEGSDQGDAQLKPENSRRHLELVTLCQGADADMGYLRLYSVGSRPSNDSDTDAFGNRRGLFESWLFFWLCKQSQPYLTGQLGQAPIPIWLAFGTDFLGINPSLAFGETGSAGIPAAYMSAMGERCRLIEHVVGDVATAASVPGGQGKTGIDKDLDPEFLMIGVRKMGVSNVSDISWKVLIRATISEPFQTCRIQFEVSPDDLTGSPNNNTPIAFSRYREQVNVWLTNKHIQEATAKWIADLSKEVDYVRNSGDISVWNRAKQAGGREA